MEPTLAQVLQSMAEIGSDKVSVVNGIFTAQPNALWRWWQGDSCDATIEAIKKVAKAVESSPVTDDIPALYWKAAEGAVRLLDPYADEGAKVARLALAVKQFVLVGQKIPNPSLGKEYRFLTTAHYPELLNLFASWQVQEVEVAGIYCYFQNVTSFQQPEWNAFTDQQWRDLIGSALDLLAELHERGGAHGAIDETALFVVGMHQKPFLSLADGVVRPKGDEWMQRDDLMHLFALLWQKRFPDEPCPKVETVLTALGPLNVRSSLSFRCAFHRLLKLSPLMDNFPLDLTKRFSPLKFVQPPKESRAALAKTLLSLLHHLHGKGVCHGEIEPASTLWGEGGVAIEAFGAPRSPYYVAPEEWKRETTPSKAADVWSLGAVLYRLLFGPLPWMNEKLPFEEVVERKADRGKHPKPERGELQRLLLEMLDPDPVKRPSIEDAVKRFRPS